MSAQRAREAVWHRGPEPPARVTVIIPTYNSAHVLPECLAALAAQTFTDFRVLVVDGHSPDGTAEVAREWGADVVYDDGDTRAHACETALAHVTSPYVAFTDDDAIPRAGWLEELVARLEGSDYASVGGPNYSPDDDGELAKAVDVVFGARLMSGGSRYGFTSEGDVEINHNPGCNVMYRTDFLKAAGFEEFPTAEDVVVDHKVRVMGGRIMFTPEAEVRHRRRNTLKGYWRQLFRYGEGRALASRKYRRLWQPVYPLPSAGLALLAVFAALALWEVLAGRPPRVLTIGAGLLLAYLGVSALDVSASRSPFLTLRRGLVALLLIPVGHAAWGLGYLKGSLEQYPRFITGERGQARDIGFVTAATVVGVAAFLLLL